MGRKKEILKGIILENNKHFHKQLTLENNKHTHKQLNNQDFWLASFGKWSPDGDPYIIFQNTRNGINDHKGSDKLHYSEERRDVLRPEDK